MNLLMITRKVDRDDDRAGHTFAWVNAIARALDRGKLTVICLEQGSMVGLAGNVRLYSLGKEHGVSRVRRWLAFPWLAWLLLGEVDAVFCHQNPEYTIAVWPLARLRRKRIVSWYTHGVVNRKTKLMAKCADVVLTASAESFRVNTSKRRIVGHGIDTKQFKSPPYQRELDVRQLRIVSVGRISPTKDIETLILAVSKLQGKDEFLKNNKDQPVRVTLVVVGAPALPRDEKYFASLRELVSRHGLENHVSFVGPVPYDKVAGYYQPGRTDLMINLSGTGSLDKAVLEAMASGCPVITSNSAFRGVLPDEFLVTPRDPLKLAQAITRFFQQYCDAGVNLEFQVSNQLRQTVLQYHSLSHLVDEIINACQS